MPAVSGVSRAQMRFAALSRLSFSSKLAMVRREFPFQDKDRSP
jgi:hypothetical protein